MLLDDFMKELNELCNTYGLRIDMDNRTVIDREGSTVGFNFYRAKDMPKYCVTPNYVTCSYCERTIDNPSKIRITKFDKGEPVFHDECFALHRRKKDRERKQAKRNKA